MVTPHFELCSAAELERLVLIGSDSGSSSQPRKAIDGSEASREMTMSHKSGGREDDDEDEDAVSWTGLIDAIHVLQWCQFLDPSQTRWWLEDTLFVGKRIAPIEKQKMQIISLRLKNRSWDLMPPDIVRSLASTTLGTIIAMAHRMGMT